MSEHTQHSHTENGAVAFHSTDNPIVDFFAMYNRGIDTEQLCQHLENCWSFDAKKTIAIIFNARDRENGKKEKNISNRAMIWLRRKKNNTYKKNIQTYIDKYGCWNDCVYIAIKNPLNNNLEIEFITNQLKKDKICLDSGDYQKISLCAKWTSSEKDKADREFNLAHKIADELFPNDNKKMQKYRKEFLVPLRNQIKIVESYMTSNRWTDIAYDKVPAVASKRLRNAFMKHDPEGYKAYQQKVAKGEKQIKVTGLLPHELIGYYLHNQTAELDETIELQWKALLENVKATGMLKNMLAIVDVSGSMYDDSSVKCIDVAMALGLLIAECNVGPLHKKVISFHIEPKLIEVNGNTLYEQVKHLKDIPAGLNTDFEAVFNLLIDSAKMFNIPPEQMPDTIVVLSDMQFDEAACANSSGISEKTMHQTVISKYEKTVYKPPKIVYWNLSSKFNNTFPIKSVTENVAIISGFSEQLLKVFMNNSNYNAQQIVYEILSKYENDIEIDSQDL